jgi:putative transposase
MVSLRQGLLAEGVRVSMAQLCRWFEQPRRTVYYKPVKSPPKIRPELAGSIKAMIEAEPSFGYRTVANLLGMNKNTVQRVFQKMGWQVRKRTVGIAPGCRHCRRWPGKPTSVGRPTCAGCGPAGTAG